jgi:TolA-binding protein
MNNYLQLLKSKNFLTEIKKYHFSEEIRIKLAFYHIALMMSESSGVSALHVNLIKKYSDKDYKNIISYELAGYCITTQNKIFEFQKIGGYSCHIHNKFFNKKYYFTKDFFNDINQYFYKFLDEQIENRKSQINYLEKLNDFQYQLTKKYLKQHEIYENINQEIEKNKELVALLHYITYKNDIVKQSIHQEEEKKFKLKI